jgi:uncharacterized protein YegP (UPF0339 family)
MNSGEHLHFTLIQNAAGQFVWLLKLESGAVIAQSRPYRSREAAIEEIEMIRSMAPTAEIRESDRAVSSNEAATVR